MDPDKAYKDRVGINVTQRLNEAFKAGKITRDEARDIANYILIQIEQVKTSSEVLSLLEDLSEKWPIFKDALIMEQGEIKNNAIEKTEDLAAQQASALLKNNNIDEALKVAEQANNLQGGSN